MFTLLAPAKINWFLSILNLRPDGYHNIISLMQCIELFDEIAFEESNNLEVISNTPHIPMEDNLIYKTAITLKKLYNISTGAKISLIKHIPSGAGLGGGSSDAAQTLKGLNRLWKLNLDYEDMMRIASTLGSDVSFFLNCPMAIVSGKGDIVEPLKVSSTFTLLLIKPPLSISTAWAYEEFKKLRTQNQKPLPYPKEKLNGLTNIKDKRDNIWLFYQALVQNDFSLLSSLVENDLEPVVTTHYSIISEIKKQLLDTGAYLATMTGSGSVVFGLFGSRREASIASKKFSLYWYKIVNTLTSF